MEEYQVIDVNGHILRAFQSKNQAEKYKKQCKEHGMLGVKIIKIERR